MRKIEKKIRLGVFDLLLRCIRYYAVVKLEPLARTALNERNVMPGVHQTMVVHHGEKLVHLVSAYRVGTGVGAVRRVLG